MCVSACGRHQLQTTHLFGMYINSRLYCRGTAAQTINVPTKTQSWDIIKFSVWRTRNQLVNSWWENPNETLVTSLQCAQTWVYIWKKSSVLSQTVVWNGQPPAVCCICERATPDNVRTWFYRHRPEFICENSLGLFQKKLKKSWNFNCEINHNIRTHIIIFWFSHA